MPATRPRRAAVKSPTAVPAVARRKPASAKPLAKPAAKPAAKPPIRVAPKPAASGPAKTPAVASEAVPKPAAPPALTNKAEPVDNKPPKKAGKPRVQLVRDGFTMPQQDFDIIAALKQRVLQRQKLVKKSELLRAGLHALRALSDTALLKVVDGLAPVKMGRPKKGR